MDSGWSARLPGFAAFERELAVRIENKAPFALINININSFRPFQAVYGEQGAAAAIQLLTRILTEAVELFGNASDLIAHVGDDDFYVVTSPDKALALCQRVVSMFDGTAKRLYGWDHVAKGYLECEYPPGYLIRHPLMTLSIGVTTDANAGNADPLSARRSASEVRRYARAGASCSVIRLDRRKKDLVLEGYLERRGRQREVLLAQRKAINGNRESMDFIQCAIGQLRVPATIAQSTLDYLMETGRLALPAEQRQHLAVLHKHSRQMTRIISQLTAYCASARGASQICPSFVDLGQVVSHVAKSAKELAPDKDLHVDLRGLAEISPLTIDEQKLYQSLFYVLCSLIELSSSRLSLTVEGTETGERVLLTLTASGLSLGRDDLASLFRRFSRPQREPVPGRERIGLGFHLARESLASIGGRLIVRRGDGIAMTFDLPKMWQSVEDRGKRIQREVASISGRAKAEVGRIEALLRNRQDVPQGFAESVSLLMSLIDSLALEGHRVAALVDEISGQARRARQRVAVLEAGFLSFAEILVDLVESRHACFAGHSKRVASEALAIGRELGLAEEEMRGLYFAGILHDLGMATLPDRVLMKIEPLTLEERSTLQQHPVVGASALGCIEATKAYAQPVLHHHEQFDGKGYPSGIKGEKIPLAARILAVADAYDALTSGRPFKPPVSPALALEAIANGAGSQFDPNIIAAFRKLHSQAVNTERDLR